MKFFSVILVIFEEKVMEIPNVAQAVLLCRAGRINFYHCNIAVRAGVFAVRGIF